MSNTHITVDLEEGRYLPLCCIACREEVVAKLAMASPVRMYVVALDCEECGESLVEFDQFSMEAA